MMNIALVGYGYWGPNLAKNIMISNATNLYAICDMSNDRLFKARQVFQEQTKYLSDYHELLEDKDIQAVAIAIDTKASYQVAIDLLNAGKHLFMEKPLASSSALARNIMETAKANNRIVHTDHLMIFHPIVRKIKSLVTSGELGELIYFDSSRMNLGPIKSDVSAMWDLAVHDLAVIDYLSGGLEPNYISAIGQKWYGDQETFTYLTLKYGNFIAHLKSSWISPVKERRMIIAGTQKMIVFDDMKLSEKMMIYDKRIDINEKRSSEYGTYEFEARTGDVLMPYVADEDTVKNSIEHFADAVKRNKQSISGPEQAIRVIKILETADQMLKSKG